MKNSKKYSQRKLSNTNQIRKMRKLKNNTTNIKRNRNRSHNIINKDKNYWSLMLKIKKKLYKISTYFSNKKDSVQE